MSREQPRRLGRGLSSIIPIDSPVQVTQAAEADQPSLRLSPRLAELPIEQIRANPAQPRKTFDDAALRALADSLSQRGTLQPVIVRPRGGGYELVAGERRWRAARLAGLSHIPAIVRDADDTELLELALAENLHRADLNAVERARAYFEMKSRLNIDNDELARRLGEDRSTVANYLRILDLPVDVLDLVATGGLSIGHAKAILAAGAAPVRSRLAARAFAEGWSVRQTESAARAGGTVEPPAAAPAKRPAVSEMERALSDATRTRVSIREGRKRHTGRIVIEYYSLDDFERITAALGVARES
ncbi:MAG: ParB/RepB/Spo0J family partition protein [Phycisphaerae bacterium]